MANSVTCTATHAAPAQHRTTCEIAATNHCWSVHPEEKNKLYANKTLTLPPPHHVRNGSYQQLLVPITWRKKTSYTQTRH